MMPSDYRLGGGLPPRPMPPSLAGGSSAPYAPTLLNSVDFSMHAEACKRYPENQQLLPEYRKQHTARAIKQAAVYSQAQEREREYVQATVAQLDACVDWGLGAGCGYMSVLLPETPMELALGSLSAVEAGLSLYRFTLRSKKSASPSQLQEEANALVKRMFSAAVRSCMEREASDSVAKVPKPGRLRDEPYSLPEEKIVSWADKPSLRQHLESLVNKYEMQEHELVRLGLYVPPVQTSYADGASCRFAVHGLELRLSEDTFVFTLMVDGGSALSSIMLRNHCDCGGGGPSLEEAGPAFSAARCYSDMARDAQAYVLLSWMKNSLRDDSWQLTLPDRRHLMAQEGRFIFFSEPFVVNHYNSFARMQDVARSLGQIRPPDVVQLYKEMYAIAHSQPQAQDPPLASRSYSAPALPQDLELPSTSTAPAFHSAMSKELERLQARRQLEQFRKKQETTTRGGPSSSSASSSTPLLGGGTPRLADLGQQHQQHQHHQPHAMYARSVAFFNQCTSIGASGGGLALQDPDNQALYLFVSMYKIGTTFHDIVRSSPAELAMSGVASVDRRCEMLPNIELGYTKGAFPRFLPSSTSSLQLNGTLEEEVRLRTFPPAVEEDFGARPAPAIKRGEALLSFLSEPPVMLPAVNRSDGINSSVHRYDFVCLALHSDASETDESLRWETAPWSRSLYELQRDGDFACRLRDETQERKIFLHSAIDYMIDRNGVQSEFFAADHYLVRTAPDFLRDLVEDRLGKDFGEYLARHYTEGTPIPPSLWDIIGDESARYCKILPQSITPETVCRVVASWQH